MKTAYLFLADGFEEIEALTVVDILRRARIPVETVSVMEQPLVTGSHGISVMADRMFGEDGGRESLEEGMLFVLPGGMPGTNRLAAHEGLGKLLRGAAREGKMVAAICAAPSVLGGLGLLEGRTAVCYPGFEDKLTGAVIGTHPVEVSGNITTSRGMGTAIPFALALVAQLQGQEAAETLAEKIVYNG